MAQRRFGPTRGAGVVIIELEGQKSIEPGALGFGGYAGVMEKGTPGELVIATNKAIFNKKMGSLIPDSLLPDAAEDYYDLANGAGGLLLVRVTDGNEQQAQATLFQRIGALLTPMGTLKAHNGGRWGGAERRHTDDIPTPATDLTDTTLDTGLATFATDEWKGGFIELDELPNIRFPIVGNTSAGVISVAADQKMKTLYDISGGADPRYHLIIDENRDKAVSYLIEDGEDNPTTEFAMSIFIDGDFVKKYANLNTDPASPNYWVNVINDSDGNDEIEVVDLVVGAHTAATRPANHYGIIDTVTTTVLTALIHDFTINSPSGGDPTVTLDATDDEMVPQKITVTMSAATAGTAVSDKFGALGAVTLGTPFVPNTKWAPEFTITAGGTPLVATDTLVINYKPFKADALIGGFLHPDKPNAPTTKFRIVDNNHVLITVADGSDLTTDGAPADEFLVEAALDLEGGRDGNADLTDALFNQAAWDTGASPFNRIAGKNLGLIKFASPGNVATAVGKAGAAYAQAKNHQYRQEVPSNIVTDDGAISHFNNTLGRTEYSVAAFPSYGSVPDPAGGAGLKSVTLTGMIHGREARIAVDNDGYHKAEAGIDATLPELMEIPTSDRVLNEELLNPAGLQVIKKVKGNFIIWGDRTLYLDSTWKFKHQRELMSFYEHVLQENFDFIVFAISDPITEKIALAALRSFFQPEFVKRALRGNTFDDAAKIKIDAEINTDATRSAGDMFAEIGLQLADTVERFIIKIGKQGIFEA